MRKNCWGRGSVFERQLESSVSVLAASNPQNGGQVLRVADPGFCSGYTENHRRRRFKGVQARHSFFDGMIEHRLKLLI